MSTTGPVQPSLLFRGSTPLSRHTSSMGAVAAIPRVSGQCAELLGLYQQHGPLTDREAARLMGVDRSTINARRATLIARGEVAAQPIGSIKNPETGITNARWGVTPTSDGGDRDAR